eukprot:Lankesteria_metandrocarpae@DN1344_c0_g1_i1.p1
MLAKMEFVAGISGPNMSRELFDLVKAIGESRSKQEEDRIISNEVVLLKKNIAKPCVTSRKMREYLIRAIYVQMLGHDASFAHIHAVNQAQEKDLRSKKVGYLACSLCLNSNHEFLLLLINTVQRDLSSPNFLEVSAALSAVARLLNAEMIPAVRSRLNALLTHQNESIRKKAIMVLQKCLVIQHDDQLGDAFDCVRRCLCDADASVRGAALHLLHYLTKRDLDTCKDFVPALVSLLKQILDHRLPRDYDYHRVPAPWMQIQLLSLLSILGSADQMASEQMVTVLLSVVRTAEVLTANIGFAILYECIRTITNIYPHSRLLELAAASISRFMSAENNNLQFVGLTGLTAIVKVNPIFAAQHQLAVVECLEDSDETLKRKTLTLLCSMTNPSNIRAIVEKLLLHVKGSTDKHWRTELVYKIADLAERYACENFWYLDTMNTIFERAGDVLSPSVGMDVIRLIAEGPGGEETADNEFRKYAVEKYIQILARHSLHIPDILIRVASWCLGEFSGLAENKDEYTPDDVCDLLCDLMDRDFEEDCTRHWVATAIIKLYAHHGRTKVNVSTVQGVFEKYSGSDDADLHALCETCLALIKYPKLCERVLPYDAFCEDLEVDPNLTFLDGYVAADVALTHRKYLRPSERPPEYYGSSAALGRDGNTTSSTSAAHHAAVAQLRFDAYEAPDMSSLKALTEISRAAGAVAHSGSNPLSGSAAAGVGGGFSGGHQQQQHSSSGAHVGWSSRSEGFSQQHVAVHDHHDGFGGSVVEQQSDVMHSKQQTAEGRTFHSGGPLRWGPSGYNSQGFAKNADIAAAGAYRRNTDVYPESGERNPPAGSASGVVPSSAVTAFESQSHSQPRSSEMSKKELMAAALFSGLTGASSGTTADSVPVVTAAASIRTASSGVSSSVVHTGHTGH